MSGIVLSASVRQNLLSLQSTAALLATTQNDLATGNKVNSALDNPTNFFTAAGLNNRASDIGNLLDSIGNGVQVLQAANTGITSLQGLVSSAQSIANQVLQTPVGYSTKSNFTSAALTGATANNLLGNGTAATSGTVTAGAFTTLNVSGTASAGTDSTLTGTVDLSAGIADSGANQTFTVNGTTVTLATGSGTGSGSSPTQNFTAVNIAAAINGTSGVGVTASVNSSNQLVLTSSTVGTTAVTVGGSSAAAIFGALPTSVAGTAAGAAASETFSLTVDGGSAHNVSLSAASVATFNGLPANSSNQLNAASLSATDVASLINSQVGSSVASVVGGKLTFTSTTTGASSSIATTAVTLAGGATGSTGVVVATNAGTAATTSDGLAGENLTIGATGGGTATNITFGTGAGQISTLNALNTALAANNLQATIDSSTGKINIVTSNDAASSTIGALGGTAVTTAGAAFSASSSSAPVVDPNSQATRASLVAQYNQVLQQINTTSQDSSFNGVNLLNGDTLNLTFDETGASKLSITGVTFNGAGLGLSTLAAGTDFLDNSSANNVLSRLQNASTTLRGEASSLGSNLSIVEIRQDFNKNLINVLQTGASNLTLADPNQEAANSQALSTRQSIAVSALALANQSQQSVLQLLR